MDSQLLDAPSSAAMLLKKCCKNGLVVPGRSAIEQKWLSELIAATDVALENFSQNTDGERMPFIRSYLNGSRNFELDDDLLKVGRAMPDRIKSISADKGDVNVFISDINRWNDELTQLIAPIRGQLPPELDSAITDCRITLIMGTGGYTPLGVHSDGDRRYIMHVPLQGGGKQMHIMKPEEYNRITGHNNPSMEFASIVPHMESYPLVVSEAVFFPGKWFHVFSYSGFSMTLVLIVKPLSDNAIINRAQEQGYCSELIGAAVRKQLNLKASREGDPSDEPTAKILDISHWAASSAEFALRRDQSSLGFIKGELITSADKPLTTSTSVHLVQPFRISYLVDPVDEQLLHVFARGERLEVANSSKLRALLDLIALGKPVSLNTADTIELNVCGALERLRALERTAED